jgi:hypothetical protein
MKREGNSQRDGGEEKGKNTNVDVSRAVRVAIHHLQQLSGLCKVGRSIRRHGGRGEQREEAYGEVERNRVRRRLQANEVVATLVVRLEASTTMVLGLLRRLSVVESVGSLWEKEVRKVGKRRGRSERERRRDVRPPTRQATLP